MSKSPSVEKPWSEKTDSLIDQFKTSSDQGLSSDEAKKRLEEYGPNKLSEQKQKSVWEILWDQMKTPVVYLLAAAAVLSFAMGDIHEGVAIVIVLLINAAIGFWMEWQAQKSMNALKEMDKITATVIRDGEEKEIDAEELVPGDVVVLGEGNMVPADLRLIEVSDLQIDESPLTGESVPVEKKTDTVDADTQTADRINMAYKGTAVSSGKGRGVVTATAMDTEIGNVSEMVSSAEEESIPLNRRLASLSKKLIWVIIGLAVILSVSGWIAGRDVYKILQTSIAWVIAAIPEGLPIVASIALAKGMLRLADHNVIVKRLAAVETLGETNVILTDKTGTLTENRLTVHTLYLGDTKGEASWNDSEVSFEDFEKEDEIFKRFFEISVLGNDASYNPDDEDDQSGDPLEIGLLRFAHAYDNDRTTELQDLERVGEDPFDTEDKRMGTVYKSGDGYFMAGKGAAEAMLDICTKVLTADGEKELKEEDKKKWLERNDEMANDGLRALAFAYRKTDGKPEGTEEGEFMKDMVLVGLVGFLDPPRKDVIEAIDICHKAGIEVVMVTGDHPGTANNVARAVHLIKNGEGKTTKGSELEDDIKPEKAAESNVFARVDPEQKLKIVQSYQEKGWITGMTGDGVNDAPALKKADIGIAMGERGTQVAKEVADMVLKDDSFPAIVEAIREGRIIFGNIRRFVVYQLSYHFSEIVVIAAVMLALYELPLLPLQLLFLNILLDVFPALALGVGRGRDGVMTEPPKDPEEPIITKKGWMVMGLYGLIISAAATGAYFYAYYVWNEETSVCNNVAFFALSIAQLFNVFNMRDHDENFFKNQVTVNKYVWMALAFCVGSLLAAYFIPGLSDILSLNEMEWRLWALVSIAALASFGLIQILKQIIKS
jgi:Ca2+-transporting ATPase